MGHGLKTIYVYVNSEYDFGGTMDGGRGEVFEVKNVVDFEDAKERCIDWMNKNTDSFDTDLCSFEEYEFTNA